MKKKLPIQPAIVVATYKRLHSLQRLLDSLDRANYNNYDSVTLIISIDYSEDTPLQQAAEDFNWRWGTKKVIQHQQHLGLSKNILFCGDLSQEYEAVIVLEDDLIVSPGFYDYACQAIAFYDSQPEIAGISLYSDIYNEYTQVRFVPVDDGYDNYFLQIAASWGQVWTKQQWQPFRQWYGQSVRMPFSEQDLMPQFVINWPDPNDWKKHFIRYLVVNNCYFVVPRSSLSTNCGESGTHITVKHGNYHTYLLLSQKKFQFSLLSESQAVYDCYYELEAKILKVANQNLADWDFECDFYGSKDLSRVKSPYVLTIRNSRSPIISFSSELVPQELNAAFELEGDFYHLTSIENCLPCPQSKKLAQYINLHQYSGVKKYLTLAIYSLRKKLNL